MYIRWKRYVLRRTADVTLKAFLVDSVRVAGRPRQRILGYLGAIRERYQQAPAHRLRFWSQVAPRLTALQVDPGTRTVLEARLARVVPRLTPADLATLDAQRTALAHLAATLGDPRTRRAPAMAALPHAGHDTERGGADGTPHDSPASH
jgi:hypothetical protein